MTNFELMAELITKTDKRTALHHVEVCFDAMVDRLVFDPTETMKLDHMITRKHKELNTTLTGGY